MTQQYKKLRLTQEGYENFDGLVGHFEFANGVSAHPLSESEQAMIQAVFKTEEVIEDDSVDTSAAKKISAPKAPKAGKVAKVPDAATEDKTDDQAAEQNQETQ